MLLKRGIYMEDDFKKSINAEMKVYQKLKRLKKSAEFQDLLDLIIRNAVQKMVWTFTGDNVKTWDDFLRVRGEITAHLLIVQEVGGAEAMEEHLKSQLDKYLGPDTY